jgi:4'-phosphopantetheinyl transferase EntD
MSKTLIALPQITTPTIAARLPLETDIARLSALNPRELLALAVYLRAKELANDASYPLTKYDPDTLAARILLKQDATTIFGPLPTGDLMRASVAIDWANCKAVYGAISSDVDTLGALAGVVAFREWTEDDLRRILLYLRLEIGE